MTFCCVRATPLGPTLRGFSWGGGAKRCVEKASPPSKHSPPGLLGFRMGARFQKFCRTSIFLPPRPLWTEIEQPFLGWQCQAKKTPGCKAQRQQRATMGCKTHCQATNDVGTQTIQMAKNDAGMQRTLAAKSDAVAKSTLAARAVQECTTRRQQRVRQGCAAHGQQKATRACKAHKQQRAMRGGGPQETHAQ